MPESADKVESKLRKLLASESRVQRVVSGPERPVASKLRCALISTGCPFTNCHGLPPCTLRTLNDTSTSRYSATAMTSLVDSPMSSTHTCSIAHRRGDFAPTKANAHPASA